MPRLTNANFLKIHSQLRLFWLHDQVQFAELTPAEQWNLRAYFQPAKDLTDQQLLVHRKVVTWHRPTLPHQAGKALANLWRGPSMSSIGQRLAVLGVVRPEPDIHKLARALKALAEHHHQPEEHEPPAA